MSKNYKRTLVTCALPYANGPVHIGHLAGVYVPADIYVRYLRMRGEDVLYVCGSDEHGVPITIKARAQGVSPQDIVDRYHRIIKDSFSGLGINFDIYSRTTSDVHERNASEFFRKLYTEGKFITKESEQYYDPEAKTFLADRYIVGTCPKCGAEGAYGDQCEKCGSTLSPEELIDSFGRGCEYAHDGHQREPQPSPTRPSHVTISAAVLPPPGTLSPARSTGAERIAMPIRTKFVFIKKP